jgi:hypothetical protein
MRTSIGIFFHKDSKKTKKIANDLFRVLYRDFEKPSEKGLMLDTYFHKVDEEIDLENYECTYYIFLLDDYLVRTLVKNEDKYENNSLLISFTKNTGQSSFNTKKVYLSAKKENVELGIFTFLASRFYAQKNMNLFLSHTKQGKIGFDTARDYNSYIQNHTKLKSFIDVNDINHGERVKNEIDERLSKENTIFAGFNTELYSTSKWTQYELLLAKKNKVPIIVIECFNERLDRSFPYMGNCLVLRNKFVGNTQKDIIDKYFDKSSKYKKKNTLQNLYNKAIEDNITDILKEAVRLKANKDKMEEFKCIHKDDELVVFNNSPELVDFLELKEENLNILYPEPPVTDEELKILNTTKQNFFTPMTYMADKNLNKNIGISISEVTGEFDNGFGNIHLYTAQEEIAKYLLCTNNKITYGGNINFEGEFNFVKVLANISNKYGFRDKNVINYSLHMYYKNIPPKIISKYNNIINFIDYKNDISMMREKMAEKCDARIVLGGKYYDKKYSGLLEESYQTIKVGNPLFLIGGFGGFTRYMIDFIKGEDIDIYPFNCKDEYIEVKNTLKDTFENDKLNGLTKDENEELFYSISIERIVYLILKGIKNIKEKR